MLEESLLASWLIIEGHRFGEYREIACLLEISGSTEDEDLKKVEATIRRLLSGKSDDSNKSSESKCHKYWIPREYRYVEHLPLTETGKPKRCCLA